MPETITLTVTGTELRANDVIVSGNNRATVVKVDRKVKWMTLTLKNETGTYTRDLLIDSLLNVKREQPTEAEKQAKRDECEVEFIVKFVNGAQARFEQAVGAQAEYLAKGYSLGYSQISNVIEAQARLAIARNLQSVHDYRVEQGDSETQAWLTAKSEVQKTATEKALHAAKYGDSRSTNQMSNAIEDLEVAVWAKYAGDAFYF